MWKNASIVLLFLSPTSSFLCVYICDSNQIILSDLIVWKKERKKKKVENEKIRFLLLRSKNVFYLFIFLLLCFFFFLFFSFFHFLFLCKIRLLYYTSSGCESKLKLSMIERFLCERKRMISRLCVYACMLTLFLFIIVSNHQIDEYWLRVVPLLCLFIYVIAKERKPQNE